MDTSYCFISGITFSQQYNEVNKKSKVGHQNAANAFQLSFIDGFMSNVRGLDIINLPFLGSWPINYKSIYPPKTETFEFINSKGVRANCKNLSFLNLTYFKNQSREHQCFNALKSYCKQRQNNNHIFLIAYSLHLPFINALMRIKAIFKNVRTIVIVTDLPEFKNDSIPFLKKWLLNYDTHISKKQYNSIDGYVLLSKYMAEKVIYNKQPFEIIEGLFTESATSVESILENNNTKTIFYSGTLARRYNIMNLMEAFNKITDPTVRLQICGNGACKDDIVCMSKKDPRIEYLGEIPREKVLALQKEADVLVNPRTSIDEFTKYSFPSKTMEYLASGTPTILYKLPGIPEEYYKYCYALNDADSATLKNKIEEILRQPKSERINFGNRARKFIVTQKNSEVQTKRILKLIERIK